MRGSRNSTIATPRPRPTTSWGWWRRRNVKLQQAESYYQKALEIYIEFNDRYSQALTYHQLGTVAEKKRHWEQAREYVLRALRTFAEFQDQHHFGICLRSLARLWRASADATIPGAVAAILGVKPEEVEGLFEGSDSENGAG